MRKRRSILALAGVAIVLVAAGWLLWWPEDDPEPTPTGDDGASDVRAARRMGGERETAPVPPPPISADDDPAGPLRLEGQVLGPDDAPVGGALVSLSSVPPRTATSEDDGSFVFDQLVPRTYSLSAKKDELVAAPLIHTLDESTDPVILRMVQGSGIDVEVVAAADEKPIAGARVSVLGIDGEPSTTDQQGIARLRGLAPGQTAVVMARASGYAPEQQLVETPAAGGQPRSIRLVMRSGAGMSGIVVDQAGKPVAGAAVSLRDMAKPFDWSGLASQSATTNKRGRFELEAVAPGTYRASASHRDYAPGSSDPLEIDGQTPISDVRIVLEAGGTVAGIVEDAGGAPVPWATVRIGDLQSNLYVGQATIRQVVAGDDGRFEMRGLPRRELLAMALSKEATSQSIEIDLASSAEARDVQLRLDIDGVIAGVVVDGQGEPVAETAVNCLPDFFAGGAMEDFHLRGTGDAMTDGAGKFRITGLPSGTYRLYATGSGLAGNPFARRGVQAATGDTDVTLVLESDGGLRGKVTFEDGSAPELFTVSYGFSAPSPVASSDGAFELASVPPGKHDVAIRGPSFAETIVRDIEVTADKVTDLGSITVKRGRSVAGRVLTSSGAPVEDATVVIGSQLFGDGRSLATTSMAGFDDQMGIRRTTTGEDGRYVIRGIGKANDLLIAAEHDQHGRSQAALVPAGADSVEVDLRLAGVGSLRGVVRAGGKPAASAQVVVTPVGASKQNIMVTTGDDGSFHVQRLAAGKYQVTGMLGAGMGSTMGASDAVIEADRESTVEIDIELGEITVIVAVTPTTGTIDMVQVFLFEGDVRVKNAKELTDAFLVASQKGGAKMVFSMGQSPAKLTQVTPGKKSLCLIPVTGDVADPTFLRRLQEQAEQLEVHCTPLTVAPSPAEQRHEVSVPPMKPLPPPPE